MDMITREDVTLSVAKESVSEFHAFHIPALLFEGLKAVYGVGDEWRQDDYRLSHLSEQSVGFPGVIGHHEKMPNSLFCIWPMYSEFLDSMHGPAKLLQVTAQEIPWGGVAFAENQKVVGYGKRETITLRFFAGQARELSCPALPFTLWVWQKTLEIYQSENRQPERSFWIRSR